MFSFRESHPYPLSNYYQSPSLTVQDNNNYTFPQQHLHQNLFQHEQYNNLLSPLVNPPLSENYFNDDILMAAPISSSNLVLQAPIDLDTTMNCPPNMINNDHSSKKAAGRKDRHTKICTAQGLRDRRVRLSISIARDFFNLQDMLGFDKASKTLGWLMAKSKAAIDELAGTSRNNSETVNCSSSITDFEVEADQNINMEEEEKQDLSAKSSKKKRPGRKDQSCNKGDHINVAREVMRAKARERARERTKNKKMVSDHNIHPQTDQHHQQRAQQNLIIGQSSSSLAPQNTPSSYGFCSQGLNNGGESSVNKTKSRGSCYNYNHEMSSNDYLTRSALENNGSITRPPGFSTLNIINLSTAIHINAKPWDTSNSNNQNCTDWQ